MSYPFFKNQGPLNIFEILKLLNLSSNNFHDQKVYDIKDLFSASKNDLTFFHSKKYKDLANITKAAFCITKDLSLIHI